MVDQDLSGAMDISLAQLGELDLFENTAQPVSAETKFWVSLQRGPGFELHSTTSLVGISQDDLATQVREDVAHFRMYHHVSRSVVLSFALTDEPPAAATLSPESDTFPSNILQYLDSRRDRVCSYDFGVSSRSKPDISILLDAALDALRKRNEADAKAVLTKYLSSVTDISTNSYHPVELFAELRWLLRFVVLCIAAREDILNEYSGMERDSFCDLYLKLSVLEARIAGRMNPIEGIRVIRENQIA
jgi:hypothetical protein